MMNNFEKLKSMSVDNLAEWLSKNGRYENSPWSLWFDKKYCSNCESIMCSYPNSTHKFPCAWCELNDGCKFFPDTKGIPSDKKVIEMWLKVKTEDGEF
jgi:hypothetical protein